MEFFNRNANIITQKNSDNENNNLLLNKIIKYDFRAKRISTSNGLDKQNSELKIDLSNKNNKHNDNNLFLKNENIKNNLDFINKFLELQKQSIQKLKETNYKEYYLISKDWFIKLINILKSDTNSDIKNDIGKINNYDFLIDKDSFFINTLFINQQYENINLIKPKFSFIEYYNPVAINDKFWTFLFQEFNGGPEVKEKNDYYEKKKQIDFSKYIKINLIILPKKDINIKVDNEKDISEIKNELLNQIQKFNFFINKNKRVNDLYYYLFELKNKYSNLLSFNTNEFKCWIDLNYHEFDDLIKIISDNILLIYNFNNNEFKIKFYIL